MNRILNYIENGIPLPLPILLAALLLALVMILLALRIQRRSGAAEERGGANYIKGLTYLTTGETEKAIDEFVRLARMDPDSLEAYLSLGNLYRSRGDLDRAIRLHRGILARPGLDRQFRMQVLMALGEDYQRAGLWGRAKEVFGEARKLFPEQPESYRHLRRIYEEEKNWAKAFEIQKEINRITGKRDRRLLAYIKTEEGKTLLSAGEKQKARRCFKEAVKLDAGSPEALMNLARYHYEEGKVEQAVKLWEELALTHPQAAHLVLPHIDEALFEKGKYDQIKETLEKILERYPDNAPARLHLGDYYLKKGMLDDAMRVHREILDKYPGYRPARMGLFRTLLQEGIPERIMDELQSMVEEESLAGDVFTCGNCGLRDERFRWRCPRCHQWDTYKQKLG
jgi:lipopolysaccharide biosynthesis regulator YciM